MKVILSNVHPFNLQIIAEGGQAFRWNRQEDGSYIGVVGDYVYQILQKGDSLIIESNADEKGIELLKEYLDISTDYNKIEQELMRFKEIVPAVKYCSGYRILKQDPWETTISFIISANNSIRNIKRIIENICKAYGKPIVFKEEKYYSFPSPKTLAETSEEELKSTKCGYRASHIINTARMVCDGKINFSAIKDMPTDIARKELMRLPGVGRKVADCIMLYSMGKYDAFPIDVWIGRVMQHIYFNGTKVSNNKIQRFAHERFKKMAGFVQQYLFYYTRNSWNDIISEK